MNGEAGGRLVHGQRKTIVTMYYFRMVLRFDSAACVLARKIDVMRRVVAWLDRQWVA